VVQLLITTGPCATTSIVFSSKVVQKDQQDQITQTLKLTSSIIEYDNALYLFHGLSKEDDFNRYEIMMKQSQSSFKSLRDPKMINKKPIRIKVVSIKRSGDLKTALLDYNMKTEDLEKLAILNGMLLTDQVEKGRKIKTFSTLNPNDRP